MTTPDTHAAAPPPHRPNRASAAAVTSGTEHGDDGLTDTKHAQAAARWNTGASATASPEQMQRLRRLALARPSSATEALPYATVRGYAGPGSALIGVVIVLGVVMILGSRLRAYRSKRGR